MKVCSACGHQNVDRAHFCGQCGTSLVQAQPAPPEFSMRLSTGQTLKLAAGTRLSADQITGLVPVQTGSPVAKVEPHPQDPTILGLRNLSCQAWRATVPQQGIVDVPPQQTAKLTRGVKFQFGATEGEVL